MKKIFAKTSFISCCLCDGILILFNIGKLLFSIDKEVSDFLIKGLKYDGFVNRNKQFYGLCFYFLILLCLLCNARHLFYNGTSKYTKDNCDYSLYYNYFNIVIFFTTIIFIILLLSIDIRLIGSLTFLMSLANASLCLFINIYYIIYYYKKSKNNLKRNKVDEIEEIK